MKRLLLILALCCPFLMGATCSPRQQTITYNTMAVTGMAVNQSYTAYLDLVVKGKVVTNSVPTISAAYNEFQATYGVALAIAQFNPNAVAPSNVVAGANAFISKVNLTEGKAP